MSVPTLGPPEQLDFHHSRSIAVPQGLTPLQAWQVMTAQPLPLLRTAFRIRDAISSRFGVTRIGGFSSTPRDTVQAGEMLDFFLVEHIGPDLLVLTVRDRHLDVMTSLGVAQGRLTVSASVVTHNTFGRLYMLPVGPAHRLIVRLMLWRLARRLARESGA